MSTQSSRIPPDTLLALLPRSPDIYLQKVDLVRRAGLAIELNEAGYRAVSFLDDRILGPTTRGGWLPLPALVSAAQQTAPRTLHYIFHTGHVGSTLLTRLLEESGHVLSLREPLPLRTLAEAADSDGQIDALISSEELHVLQACLQRLWSRTYRGTQHVVLKATSSAGRLAERLLGSDSESRAVYMNLRAENYLATLLAGRNSHIDLRGHAPERIRRLQARVETRLRPLHALSLGELAALSWLAETSTQLAAMRAFGDRIMALDFERFLGDVRGSLERVLTHFGLPLDPSYLSNVAQSPALTRYSKATDVAYSPEMRAQLLQQSRRDNAEEIRRGLAWIEAIARQEPSIATVLNVSEQEWVIS